MGSLSFFVKPIYLIGGLIGILLTAVVIKYEFFGLILYLIIFLLRPGETYPALAKVRPEFLLGALLSFIALIKNKYKYGILTIPDSKLNFSFILLIWGVGLSLLFSACKVCSLEVFEILVKLGIFYFINHSYSR